LFATTPIQRGIAIFMSNSMIPMAYRGFSKNETKIRQA